MWSTTQHSSAGLLSDVRFADLPRTELLRIDCRNTWNADTTEPIMKRPQARIVALTLLSALLSQPAAAQQTPSPPQSSDTLIRNATILTITRGTLQNTDLLISK